MQQSTTTRKLVTGDNMGSSDISIFNHAQKDDWAYDERKISNSYNLQVPSFIRLFVIRRIICHYIKDLNTKNRNVKNWSFIPHKQWLTPFKHEREILYCNPVIIDDLIDTFNYDRKLRMQSKWILINLINFGIREYMDKWYNENKRFSIIEIIFNKLILNKFANEYNTLTTYNVSNDNNNNNIYKRQLFNSNDLMCKIFQYLEYQRTFDGDLFNCSLVNSCWLYHSWNVNSVYYVDLNKLIDKTLKFEYKNKKDGNNNNITRMWQRLIHAKSIYVSCWHALYLKSPITQLLLNRISLLRKVEKMYINLDSRHNFNNLDKAAVLKALISRSRVNIKSLWIKVSFKSNNYKLNINPHAAHELMLSPLVLPNATFISVHDLNFYRIWSNKCQRLCLGYMTYINKNWCQFVIKHCNCSGIKNLKLTHISFNNNCNESILQQLACKFTSLKKLEISLSNQFDINDNVIFFWQLLKSILVNNNAQVELSLHDAWDCQQVDLLQRMMKKGNLKIDKMYIGDVSFYPTPFMLNNFCALVGFIAKNALNGLKKLKFNADDSGYSIDTISKVVSHISFTSINVLEMVLHRKHCGALLDHVNNFLTLMMDKINIIAKKIFIIVNMRYFAMNNGCVTMFERLCQNVSKLFIKRNPIDICISFNRTTKDCMDSCSKIYSSYFEKKQLLMEYRKAQCDTQICLPRVKPFTYFVKETHRGFKFKATNVEYV